MVGSVMTVRWSIDTSIITKGVDFGLSADNGRTWVELSAFPGRLTRNSDTLYEDCVGTFHLTVPATGLTSFGDLVVFTGDSCLLKVQAPYDSRPDGRGWPEDECDEVFSIRTQ